MLAHVRFLDVGWFLLRGALGSLPSSRLVLTCTSTLSRLSGRNSMHAWSANPGGNWSTALLRDGSRRKRTLFKLLAHFSLSSDSTIQRFGTRLTISRALLLCRCPMKCHRMSDGSCNPSVRRSCRTLAIRGRRGAPEMLSRGSPVHSSRRNGVDHRYTRA